MEQTVSPVLMVQMVCQVQKVGNLPTKVSNYHTQPEHNILSVLSQKVSEVGQVLQVRVKYITSQSSTLNIVQSLCDTLLFPPLLSTTLVGWPTSYQVDKVNKVRRFITFPTPLALSGKHSTQSMTAAFCFLLGNTHGVPSVIQVHQVRPLKSTLIHSVTCFCSSAHWKYNLTHTAKTAGTA